MSRADLGRGRAGEEGRPSRGIAAKAEPCDVCGAPTIEIHCKVLCRTCGYTRDCEDP